MLGRAMPSAVPLILATSLVAQAPRLGTVHFPTSQAGEAQEAFVEGVLFMHSFEYASAARAFQRARDLAPGFAMAHWGEAMTHNHPIWNERDRAGAIAVLERLGPGREARLARAPTERERAYLAAVEELWAEGPKAERDTAYSLAMEELVRRYPEDVEARAFYALSLMGLSQGVRMVPTYVRAGAIAAEVLREHPSHPGAAHYVIHAFDDPIHAPLGLTAARSYSTIAPDAAHAQHMTTHIFVAMGMWDDVVSQNEVAAGLTHWGPGHYTSWLGYGMLQQGRFDAARKHLERARANLRSPAPAGQRAYLATMRAHYLINTERWDDEPATWELDLSGAGTVSRAIDAFAVGYAALRRGDRQAAEQGAERLTTVAGGTPGAAPYGGQAGAAAVLSLVLRAALAETAGDLDQATRLLEAATALEDTLPVEFGPPDVVKPSHELFGEVLLRAGKPAVAQREFQRALELAPKRALSLRGLAEAARRAGDVKTAQRAARMLAEIWHAADAGITSDASTQR